MTGKRRRRELGTLFASTALVIVAVAIIWIDIATSLWQEVVVLSGFAGALLSFLFTVLVLKRIIAHQTARRWAPMIRLALHEFLHSLADEDRSEISRGIIAPRYLKEVPEEPPVAGSSATSQLDLLRERIVHERARLAASLSAWAEILTSSGANEDILLRVADLTAQLDRVRDVSIEAESTGSAVDLSAINREIRDCNRLFDEIVEAIQTQLVRITASPRSDEEDA